MGRFKSDIPFSIPTGFQSNQHFIRLANVSKSSLWSFSLFTIQNLVFFFVFVPLFLMFLSFCLFCLLIKKLFFYTMSVKPAYIFGWDKMQVEINELLPLYNFAWLHNLEPDSLCKIIIAHYSADVWITFGLFCGFWFCCIAWYADVQYDPLCTKISVYHTLICIQVYPHIFLIPHTGEFPRNKLSLKATKIQFSPVSWQSTELEEIYVMFNH